MKNISSQDRSQLKQFSDLYQKAYKNWEDSKELGNKEIEKKLRMK